MTTKIKHIQHPASELMPFSHQAQKILRERAKHFSKSVLDKQDEKRLVSYVCFRLGAHELYGVPSLNAKEVMFNIIPTKVPCVPPFIAGVINRRGALIAVIDLTQFFTIRTLSNITNPSIIVVTSHGMTMGLLADNIEGNGEFDPATLDPPIPSDGVIKADYIKGLKGGLITILNIDAMLADPQLLIKVG